MYRKAVVLVLILLPVALLHLVISANTASVGYLGDAEKKVLSKIRSENRSLAATVAQKEALPRIEEIAKNKLKMITPEKINYIVVTGESSSR